MATKQTSVGKMRRTRTNVHRAGSLAGIEPKIQTMIQDKHKIKVTTTTVAVRELMVRVTTVRSLATGLKIAVRRNATRMRMQQLRRLPYVC